MSTPVLVLPGIGDSGPEHWQTLWQQRDAALRRVPQQEWDAPNCAHWVAALDAAIRASTEPVVLAAHSAACGLVAHWAAGAGDLTTRVLGALLVAPADPSGPNYPRGATGFAPMPLQPLPFASITVTGDDDPYVTLPRAREFAAAWGSTLVVLERAGHINVASGFGPWPEGFALLDALRHTPLQEEHVRRVRQNA